MPVPSTLFRTPLALAMLAGLGMLASPTPAQQVPAEKPAHVAQAAEDAQRRFVDPTNAALLYARAWLLLPVETFTAVSDANADRKVDWVPDAALSKTLSESQTGITTIMRAAKLRNADFGLEYSQGINALLPHLSKMRASARLLAADASRLHAAGDTSAAVERLVALFGLSRHCAGDGVLISSLVSAAIHALATTRIERLLTTGSLTTEHRDIILAEMRRTNQSDPFGVQFAVLGERQWTEGWMRKNFSGPDGAKRLMDEFGGHLSMLGDAQTAQRSKGVAALTQAQFNADLDRMVKFYTEAQQLLPQPDAVERLVELEARAKKGEFGTLASVFAPALSKSKTSEAKAISERNALIEKLTAYAPAKK